MPDRYRNFDELTRHEREGVDFRVESTLRGGRFFAVVAIHGGGIERGTSELATAIAGEEWNGYRFEGMKQPGKNRDLHLTSTRFDEPRLAPILSHSRRIISIHGARGDEPVCFIGGRDHKTTEEIARQIKGSGVAVQKAPSTLGGTHRRNICNRGKEGIGVQLELTTALRRSFFVDFSHRGRRETPTAAFAAFTTAVRQALTKVVQVD
ncbi:poly-gamma-glutamate hydrolase family protein [Desmospora activa]|uniref:Phage replication-related protein YjqB (UPF0714/DUF867 family) n=1 Tax=Desmospora activa DSM 45169 TaxID=1121389 RepID=A0A2T4Z7H0_9BACL|nr:poly-gamma-glutamate hydrolase family protein [Desmospora activa]PTM57823.1 phage replication-related protein YjqB (UPF0714/DUF867 family) [Desmospora activa DSM 45169]